MERMVLQGTRGFSRAILHSLMVRKGAALCDPLLVMLQDTLHVNPPIINATAGPLRLCSAIVQSVLYCRQQSSVCWAKYVKSAQRQHLRQKFVPLGPRQLVSNKAWPGCLRTNSLWSSKLMGHCLAAGCRILPSSKCFSSGPSCQQEVLK